MDFLNKINIKIEEDNLTENKSDINNIKSEYILKRVFELLHQRKLNTTKK